MAFTPIEVPMTVSASTEAVQTNLRSGIPYVANGITDPDTKSAGDVLQYNGSAWVASDDVTRLKEDIAQLDGLSDDVKQALLAIVNHVAWDDQQGQARIDALENALYPTATLVSISAVYTQSGTVYDKDTLDSLKADLVVTATYDDSTTETVTTYTLSGTLTEGTSTITVSYGGKITTFTVTVTHATPTYVTSGLIDHWDGIDNTRSGHNASASAWEDLVGSHDLTLNSTTKATWGEDHLYFTGKTNQHIRDANSGLDGSALTVEVVLAPETNATEQVFAWFGNSSYKRAILFYSNNTISEYFEGANRSDYVTGLTNFSDIETIAITYPANSKEGTMYINNAQVAKTGSASSWNIVSGLSTIHFGNQTGSSGNYQYKGKVYAIRFYNRELTTEELTQNHQVDVTRFGLGA